jgi:hypothetical protein
MLHRPMGMVSRLGAAALVAAAMAGGAVAVAAPAGAATPQLGSCHVTVTYSVTATTITGSTYTLCPLQSPKLIPDAVSIVKYVNGNPVVVATGTGTTTYTCQGSSEHQFSVADDVFDAACG